MQDKHFKSKGINAFNFFVLFLQTSVRNCSSHPRSIVHVLIVHLFIHSFNQCPPSAHYVPSTRDTEMKAAWSLPQGNAMRTSIGRGRGTVGALRRLTRIQGRLPGGGDTGLSCLSVIISTAKGKACGGSRDQPKQRLQSK